MWLLVKCVNLRKSSKLSKIVHLYIWQVHLWFLQVHLYKLKDAFMVFAEANFALTMACLEVVKSKFCVSKSVFGNCLSLF